MVQALVPHAERGGALAIRSGDETLWERLPTSRVPRVRSFAAEVRGDVVGARVGRSTRTARTSPRSGRSGRHGQAAEGDGCASGAPSRPASPAAAPRSRRTCCRRARADPAARRRRLPHRPVSRSRASVSRTAGPMSRSSRREDGQTLVAGQPMRLWAAVGDPADDGTGDPPSEQPDARWTLDRKAAAEGVDAFVTAPKAGKHRLELTVGAGKKAARATVESVTVDLLEQFRAREADERGVARSTATATGRPRRAAPSLGAGAGAGSGRSVSTRSSRASDGKSRHQTAATAIVATPPATTAGTVPISAAAASPDSNAPSWFDALMNTISTALTRPRRSSGVASATVVERMLTLTMSAKPLTASASSESGNDVREAEDDHARAEEDDDADQRRVRRGRPSGGASATAARASAPTAGARRSTPRPTGPVCRIAARTPAAARPRRRRGRRRGRAGSRRARSATGAGS